MDAKRKNKAAKIMEREIAFDNKENALKEAVKQCRNMDNNLSIWKAPADTGGKYAIVQFKNREEATIAGYTEVYDTGAIFDKVKEQYDNIKEV